MFSYRNMAVWIVILLPVISACASTDYRMQNTSLETTEILTPQRIECFKVQRDGNKYNFALYGRLTNVDYLVGPELRSVDGLIGPWLQAQSSPLTISSNPLLVSQEDRLRHLYMGIKDKKTSSVRQLEIFMRNIAYKAEGEDPNKLPIGPFVRDIFLTTKKGYVYLPARNVTYKYTISDAVKKLKGEATLDGQGGAPGQLNSLALFFNAYNYIPDQIVSTKFLPIPYRANYFEAVVKPRDKDKKNSSECFPRSGTYISKANAAQIKLLAGELLVLKLEDDVYKKVYISKYDNKISQALKVSMSGNGTKQFIAILNLLKENPLGVRTVDYTAIRNYYLNVLEKLLFELMTIKRRYRYLKVYKKYVSPIKADNRYEQILKDRRRYLKSKDDKRYKNALARAKSGNDPSQLKEFSIKYPNSAHRPEAKKAYFALSNKITTKPFRGMSKVKIMKEASLFSPVIQEDTVGRQYIVHDRKGDFILIEYELGKMGFIYKGFVK